MGEDRQQRALIVAGAGASVEYGIPATAPLGALIEAGIAKDRYCVSVGGVDAYHDIKSILTDYYGKDANQAHFERIYHVMHELDAFRLTPGAVAKFRPVMLPFLSKIKNYPENAFRAACNAMLDVVYQTASSACETPKVPLTSLEIFFASLEERFLPRVYTTNYDDFIGQATGNRYLTGFTRPSGSHHMFDPRSFWSNWDKPGLFHLHGSIHMGFPLPGGGTDIGDIAWYASRDEAKKHAAFSGSGLSRMDGTGIVRSAIITGLDKLGRLQQSPYAFYYAALSRDAMEADIIFILGSGLADLHLNTWIKEVRRCRPTLPLVYVGYWPDSDAFYSSIKFDYEDREILLFHDLRVDLANVRESKFNEVDGWTVDAHRTAAVWSDGFQNFLAQPAALQRTMKEIGIV